MERPFPVGSAVSWPNALGGSSVLCLLSAIAVAVFTWCPLASRIEFGGDEGYELQKAFLMKLGFRLYDEIWNDQPPLHTWLLSKALALLGNQTICGRMFSLASALFVAWSVGVWAHRSAGWHGAVVVVIMLFGHSMFFLLGISAMLELPTIAAAMLAVNAAGRPGMPAQQGALVAGVLMGVAAQVKLTALLYSLSCLGLLWLKADEQRLWRISSERISAALTFLLGVTVSFFAIAALWPGELSAILPHFSSEMTAAFGKDRGFRVEHLQQEPTLLLVGALALVSVGAKNLRFALPFLLQLVTTLVVLHFHRPYWEYYILHLLVPSAVLAALPLQEGWQTFARLFVPGPSPPVGLKSALCLLAVIYSVVAGPAKFVQQLKESRQPDDLVNRELATLMRRFGSASESAFSIRPIFAFRAGLSTPPRTTVIPEKRVRTEKRLAELIRTDLESFRPGQVYLLSYLIKPVLQEVLLRDYQLLFQDGDHCLFLRRDIAELSRRAGPALRRAEPGARPGD
jgi:hypothetical protein